MHALLRQLLPHGWIIAQIDLGSDNQAGHPRAMVVNFGEPFLADVLEGGGGSDAEADEEDVRLGVGKGAETVVVLLTGGVEKAKRVRFVADPGGATLWLET